MACPVAPATVLMAASVSVWAGLAGSSARAEELRIEITKPDCARLVRHVPGADVAFQPGVGGGGRRVAPADLPGSGGDAMGNLLPEVMEIPIVVTPYGWAERQVATKEKAAAETGLAASYTAKTQAQADIPGLNQRKATLEATKTTLVGELGTLTGEKNDLAHQVGLLKTDVDAGTRKWFDPDYRSQTQALAAKQAEVDAKHRQVDANAAELAANAASIVQRQSAIDAAPARDAKLAAQRSAAEGALSGNSARGLDDSKTTLGVVRYDTLKGTFTFNGRPLGQAETQGLAEACARRGAR